MAEFALGLTKTAVAGTVSRVKLAIEEETKLRVRVQDDLVFITAEFEMMQSFLGASSAGDQASKNLVVRAWVRHLRDLAFDVEDCVEFIVHLDKPSRWDWVRRFASPVRVCMGKSPIPLDVAADEIKRLKARVEEVSQRNNRYNLITGDTSQADAHHQLTPYTYTYTGSSKASSGTLQSLLDVWKTTGRLGGHAAIDLRKIIDSDVRELQVISLWRVGSADVADDSPTSFSNYVHTMKKVYDDPVICQRFENRAWVKLSALHPFNPVEFVSNLLNKFRSRHHHHDGHHDDDHHHNHANANSTISELLQQLSQLRYLVVLEHELNTITDWDDVQMYLPDGNKGSRVVVSTNSLGIALVCTGTTYQVSELQRFSFDQGLYAFFPKCCGHRFGMDELFRRLRCSHVIFVFAESGDDCSKFKKSLHSYFNAFTKHDKSGVLGAEEFERREIYLYGGSFDLVKFARAVILGSCLDDEYESRCVRYELDELSDQNIIERSCKLLTERTYLVVISSLESTEDWDLIKKNLLCKSTRSRIVVVAIGDRGISVAKNYVDHDANRALNAGDLLQELGDGGGNVKEEEARHCELVGHHNFDCLFDDDRPAGSTMSLWGIAGVGKTAVARKMCKRHASRYNMSGWVDVPYPFDLMELCRRLLLDFYSHDIGAMESAAISMAEGQDPIQWCCQILRASKCILVLDGLRSTHDWDTLKATLLSQPTAGNALVITREESIATYCTEKWEGATSNVTCLEEDDAILLFEKIAFEGKKLSVLDPEEEKSSKLLVSKCGGLPELIVAVGKSVNNEYAAMIVEALNSDFIRILQTYSLYTSLRGLFLWMHSYFDALPDELKPCIFYMLVFPADKSVRWRRLLNRWISEGYLPGGTGTMEEKGEKLLLKLRNLSILYSEQEEQISSCMVNGFFREYIKSSPMEDNLVFALEEESRSTSSRLTAGQHLTIRESWKRDSYEFSKVEVSRLRSLTVSGVWESFLISDKMKLLRVLDLEGTTTTSLRASVTDDDLEKILKTCLRLKFLSLRGCVHITRLPDSLGEMRQLQTLDVRYTSIVELPSSITKLHKLQYIRAGLSTAESTAEPPPSTATATATATPPPPSPSSPTSAPQEDGNADMIPTTEAAAAAISSVALKRKAHDLVKSSRSSWQKLKDKQNLRRRQRVAANGGGVEFVGAAADGIGRLIHLHTLGIVNVGCQKGGLVFLKELKKLTQLRKLGLSGINGGNWSKFCVAIRGELHHLESLSLQLEKFEGSYEFACFDDQFQPPKSLKRLKVLYSKPTTTVERQVASIGPAWINKLPNLERFDHELTISTQEDISVLTEKIMIPIMVDGCCLRIKPSVEDLSFGGQEFKPISLRYLSVECSSNLKSKLTFQYSFGLFSVSTINIHCCCIPSAGGTSTAASSSCGLEIAGFCNIWGFKQVTVTGTYADDLKLKFATQMEEEVL